MEERDRQGLQGFLAGLRALLGGAVYHHPEWFPDELRGDMEAAWVEIERVFDQVSRDIDSRDYDGPLERQGLAGAQLQFKLAGFQAAAKEVGVEVTRLVATADGEAEYGEGALGEAEASEFRRRRGGRFLRYFSVALDWANAIVESIGAAIPGAGAIGEFKKGVEAATRLADERSKPFWKRIIGV